MTCTEKKCSVCGIKKDVSEFYTEPRTKTGLVSSCKVCFRTSTLRYYHSEVGQAKRKQYRLKNKAKLALYEKSEQKQTYVIAHPEVRRKAQKNYRLKHSEKLRVACRKRKALKRGNAHEPYTDTYIFERDNWICGICGLKIDKRLRKPNLLSKSIDHIIPLSKGGADAPINLQASHLICNTGKKAGSGGQLRLIG